MVPSDNLIQVGPTSIVSSLMGGFKRHARLVRKAGATKIKVHRPFLVRPLLVWQGRMYLFDAEGATHHGPECA